MKALVTGACGFIGSHLTSRLCDLGVSVRAVDNLSTGRLSNIEACRGRFELIEEDLAEPGVCAKAVRGMDVVFHQAAISAVPRSHDDPLGTHRANTDATLRLLEGCREAGVRRVVFAASSSVYGDTEVSPKHEDLPAQPKSIYAVQKHLGELYGRVYSEAFGLEFVALRYFNVFGPRQDPASEYSAVIPKFIRMMLQGQRPTIFGDGGTTRDFSYVDNVVDANLLAMSAPGVAGLSLNIGSGAAISLNALVERLNRILGLELQPVYLPERLGDVRHSLADLTRAEKVLGFRPRIGFDEGLELTVKAFPG